MFDGWSGALSGSQASQSLTVNGPISVTANFRSTVAAPAINTQPVSQTVTAGASVTFSVTASGNPSPSYQWRKNGADIAGANSSSYAISGVQPNHAGTYAVYVWNSQGNVTSQNATLTVNVPPQITSQPQSQTVAVGSSATFSVAASGFPAPSYQWRKNGTNITGATASSLALNNVQSADAGTYTVHVSNALGAVTSGNATLTVTAPAIELQVHRP